jgi:DNA-binding XRE family transcriptional regulator
MSRRGMPAEERLLSWLDTSGGPDACWPFTGMTELGYGRVSFNGRLVRAHRLAANLWVGDPTGMVVRHECDNRACCNPAHLRIGTQLENVRDRVERGRSADVNGERNPSAKLTVEQVREIRRLAGSYSRSELARRYGVNRSTIYLIATGKKWSTVA